MQKELDEIRQYAYSRIDEMPLVKAVEAGDRPEIFIDVLEVTKKYYNGVLIGDAKKVVKILTEEYGAKVDACVDSEKDSCIRISLEDSEDVIKKTLNRVEAFVSSI